MLKIGQFNSLIALGITIGSFSLIRGMRFPNLLDKIAIIAAPSMFSVFLIHCNSWCLESMHGYVDCVVSYGIPKPLAFFVVAILIFVAGVLLDIPRRIIVATAYRIYNARIEK